MDLGLSSTIASLVFSSRLSHVALLTQGSANLLWSPIPEAPTDMVLCACTLSTKHTTSVAARRLGAVNPGGGLEHS